jgi:hypothetical protein
MFLVDNIEFMPYFGTILIIVTGMALEKGFA